MTVPIQMAGDVSPSFLGLPAQQTFAQYIPCANNLEADDDAREGKKAP